MKKGPEKQSFLRSAAAMAVIALLSGRCGTEAQNNVAEENDQNPPAGAPDLEQFAEADIKPDAPEKKHPCTGMVTRELDGGVMELDFTGDGPECP